MPILGAVLIAGFARWPSGHIGAALAVDASRHQVVEGVVACYASSAVPACQSMLLESLRTNVVMI